MDRAARTQGHAARNLAKLNAAVNAALKVEPMKDAVAKVGAQPRGGTPLDLASYMAREAERNGSRSSPRSI